MLEIPLYISQIKELVVLQSTSSQTPKFDPVTLA